MSLINVPGSIRPLHIKIDRTALNEGENIIITLDFTNHKTSGPFPEESTSYELIRVTHKQGIGHISLDNWMEIAHEIASTILPYCDAGKQIHIYVNTPSALAFLIGSIVGPIQGIFLCEYNIYAKELTKTIDLGSPKLQGLGRNFDPSL